jgi:hypothetical protein
LREAAQRHGHGAKRKILASREKKARGPPDETKNRGEIKQNSAFTWICRVENLNQQIISQIKTQFFHTGKSKGKLLARVSRKITSLEANNKNPGPIGKVSSFRVQVHWIDE